MILPCRTKIFVTSRLDYANIQPHPDTLMKLTPTLLRNITLSAGLAATISTAEADNKSATAAENATESRLAAKPADAAVSPEARAVFLRHDTNKDGKLSMEEFDKAFAEINRAANVAPQPGPENNLPQGGGCPACGLG